MLLESNGVKLRSMEPSDVNSLYQWENDTSLWCMGDTMTPFSKEALKLFIESSFQDDPKDQFRFMIDFEGCTVGCIDLFEISMVNHHASVGILLYDISSRRKGIAGTALLLLELFATRSLELISLKAEVSSDNVAAINFFNKMGYRKVGVLSDWKRMEYNIFSDVTLFQHKISSF